MNLYPYIPFYNYRKLWVNRYLNELQAMQCGKLVKDYYETEMSWEVVEYYLKLAYDYMYFGESWGPGLRMVPTDLVRTVDCRNKNKNKNDC